MLLGSIVNNFLVATSDLNAYLQTFDILCSTHNVILMILKYVTEAIM